MAGGKTALYVLINGQPGERTGMVSESFAKILNETCQELKEVDSHLKQIDGQHKNLSASDEVFKRLMQIPGYGRIVSSEFVSTLGDGQ